MKLARLIEHLSDPRAYPGPTTTVEVHQTHISVVFVTDSFAYKIKKPLALEFLDYSTLDKRRHWCDEEVGLNRRLAPCIFPKVDHPMTWRSWIALNSTYVSVPPTLSPTWRFW
jgi:uncharacterized protein